MINYGKGLHIIICLPAWEGHNILFPSFTFICSLGERDFHCPALDWREGSTQKTQLVSHPAKDGLTFQKKAVLGLRSLTFFFFFLFLSLNFLSAPAWPRVPPPSPIPFLLFPHPSPEVEGGVSSVLINRQHRGRKVVCVRVFVTVAKTLCYLAV